MSKGIFIKMMGEFVIRAHGQEIGHLASKSRKGVSMIEYLILNHGRHVPRQRLINVLWFSVQNENPENALKTLVSRTRKILNQECEGLGDCIASDRGGYRWESMLGMKVDMLEIMQINEQLPRETDPKKREELCEELLRLYAGDLFLTGDIKGGAGYAAALHNQYLCAMYDYVDELKEAERYNDIIRVCERALEIDSFDERLQMEYMQAMVYVNRTSEAVKHYGKMSELTERYLGAEPSDEMRSFYRQMVRSEKKVRVSLDLVRNELSETESKKGAYICDYEMFKEIYNLQIYNLERLDSTMFLGVIMLFDPEDTENTFSPEYQEEVMQGLIGILRNNLRRGDIVARFSETSITLLLPTVDYTTGNMVMERIKQVFHEQYASENIPFNYRLGALESSNNLTLRTAV